MKATPRRPQFGIGAAQVADRKLAIQGGEAMMHFILTFKTTAAAEAAIPGLA
jgi:hypothetical protein